MSYTTPNSPLADQNMYNRSTKSDYFDQVFRQVRKLGEGDFGEVILYFMIIKTLYISKKSTYKTDVEDNIVFRSSKLNVLSTENVLRSKKVVNRFNLKLIGRH